MVKVVYEVADELDDVEPDTGLTGEVLLALLVGFPEIAVLELVDPVKGREWVCTVLVPFSEHVLPER